MPVRNFLRTSPKTSTNDCGDGSGNDPLHPAHLPLQEVSWNNLPHGGKGDELSTPRSVVKWLSSSPLPDPPFFEYQENLATVGLANNPSSLPVSFKARQSGKDGCSRGYNATDLDSGAASLRSSASSCGTQEIFLKNPITDHRSFYASPHVSTYEVESATNVETQVARSLKYGHSAAGATESSSDSGGWDASDPTLSNPCAQSHFEIEEDLNFWKEHNVQVIIRIRPLSSSELVTQGQVRCVRQDSAHAITWTGHPESRFTFDLVACETITQEKLFKVAGLPMVDNCLQGYNSCMFAYGQTGSGKTFTMLGDLEGAQHQPSANRGMTPRVFEYLFARILEEETSRSKEHVNFTCRCSFLEIYNEQILDLLEPATTNLQLREDAKRGVYVENLSEIEVKNVQDVITLLIQGAANRKVAATNMNRESSRSHSVFTCVIESRWTSQSIKNSRFGRLHLVDLAGSERQKSSGAEGERLKEAANINKSLSTLGLVIMSLVDIANGKQRHVPYRDSKLTFLLHDSLGGNSKTTIIANISPSKCCALETLSTLKFAQRAKFIRNNAMVNENAMGDVMALRLRIQKLEEENNQLRMRIMDGGMAVSENGMGSELAEHGNLSQSAYSSVAWDPFREFSTSSLCGKQRNGLELTLQRTLQRQQTAEAKIKELQAQIDQFKFLVKQKEEDTQRGKMMLRFREDKIKRMEALLKGVFSLETYISTERDSLLEEVKMLRMRLERNPEVTRFAMENIRLQEELQRYHNFYEEGERDMMEKEILLLQDQLLEALDWKLMHEEDPNCVGKGQSTSFNKKDMDDTEVESSKLEKQIETVGAVASLQAELIALQDMVISAKTAEAQACEHASSLAAEVERLKDRLKEVEENYNKNDVQVGLKQLECENTQLQSEAAEQMCAAGESLSLESELERQHDQEIEKLKAQIKLSQEELEQAGKKYAELQWMYEASEQRGALAESLKCELELLEKRHDREMEELKSQMHATREELEKGRQAYAQLQSMYEAAERRGAMAESLKNDLEVMKRGHDEEMGEFSSYRRLTEEELEKAHQEYAQLQCMYKAAEERGVIAGALKVELDSVKTRHNDEIEELKAHLHQTRNELEMAHQAYAGLQSMYKVAEERGVFVEALKLELESVKKGYHQELEDLKAHLHLAEGELMKARQAVEQREAMDEALKLEIELLKKRHTEEMEELKNHLCVGNEQSRCMVEVDQIGAICETVKLDLEHMKDGFDEEREESRAHLHWSQRKSGMACQETLRLHEVAEQRCGMAETSKQELEPVESRHDKEMQELRTELRMTQQALEMAHQENARLQSIYKVTEEREIMSETLQLEPELIRERHHVETEELKAHLTTEKVMDKSTGHEVQNEVLTKFGQNMDQELLSSVEVLEMQAEKTENSGGELEESKTQLHLTEEESRKPHEENAQMHCIYEGEERRGLAETLKESELMRKKHHVEMEELKTHIHLTQEALIERSHLEGQHGVLSACCQVVDEPSNGVEAVLRLQVGKLQDYAEEPIQSLSIGNKHDEPDIEFLKEKLIQMEEANSRLSVLLECAVAEKEAVSKDNQRYEISGRAKSSGNCLSDAKESEDIVQRVRNLNHVSDFAEPNSCCLHILENEYAIFSKLEEKLHCLLQGVEEKFKNLDATLDDATGECNGRLECLMSRVEQSYTDIMSLFVVLDASRVRNKELEEKLSKACSRLRQEEEAKDHAFFLSASDMGAFLEDKKLLQESLDVSLSTYNSKAKSWLGSLQEFESKVQLIRTQLLDLLAAIDGAITCLTNKQEGSHWSQSKSLAEVGLLEIEVERIEEQQCLSTLRVCQQENKVKALKKLSCDIQASKAEWCSREARLEDHLQKLRGALEEKESEIFEMKTEEEHYRCCLDQLLKHEEIIHLEAAALREKLHMTEQLRADVSLGAQSACSMLQLLRREEEKATLLSDILEVEEKLKNLQQGIEQMRGCADKTETAILCADVEREAAASSLQEAEAELDEVKKEIQMLVDTEEEMKGELEMLTVLHSKATSDDSMMIEQLETANKRLQFMKESIAKAGNAGLHLFSEITNTMQNSKVTLEKLVSEAQSMLGNINISIQELAV